MKKQFKWILILTLALTLAATPAIAGTAAVYNLKLNGNLTTGYDWVCTPSVEGIVEVVGEYLVPETELVGVGGYYGYAVIGQAPGEVTLTFVYSRSFDPESDSITLTYTFIVNEGLDVYCTSSEVLPY